MSKVKARIFLTQHFCDDNYDQTILRSAAPDSGWEELDKADVDLLKKNIHRFTDYNTSGLYPTLVVIDEEISLKDRVATLKELVAQEKLRADEAKKKREEAAQKKKLKDLAKNQVKEKALFDELAKKYAK